MNVAITSGGVAMYPGDIVFGDGQALVVVPPHMAEEVAAEGAAIERRESFFIGEIEAGSSIVGVHPPNAATLARYEEWSGANPA